ATLRDLRNYSFIATSRGRYMRRQQIKRIIIYLRNKYHREKGVLLNTELIEKYVKSNLGKELYEISPQKLIENKNKWKRLEEKYYDNKDDPEFFDTFIKDPQEYKESSFEERERQYNRKF